MKSKLFVIALSIVLFSACKKDKKTEAQDPATPHSNRLKNIRGVHSTSASNDHITNLTYLYNSAAQLVRVVQNDSVLIAGKWNVNTFTESEYTYTSFNKFDKIISGNSETRYIYDAQNTLISHIDKNIVTMTADTFKYHYNGNQVLVINSGQNGVLKRFYSKNLDSLVFYDTNGDWQSKTIYTYNTRTDLSLEYINRFFSVPDSYNETITHTLINKVAIPAVQSQKFARIYDPLGFPVMETTTYVETGEIMGTRYYTYY